MFFPFIAIRRALRISERQFQRMLKEGLLKSAHFSIIGLGERYRLFFPEKILEIQLLIQMYQNPSKRDKREIWSKLVQASLRCFKEFRWVIDNSKEETVRAFCASKQGKMLIDHLEKAQNRKG